MSTATTHTYDFSWAPAGWKLPPGVPAWTQYFAKAVPNPVVPIDDIRACLPSSASKLVWAPSYDDGPSPYTHIITDYLHSKNLRASFYTVGSVAIQYPQTLLDTYLAGHEIGIHTWSHPDLRSITDDNQVIAELVYSAKAIYQVTGQVPRYYRPPYGFTNERIRRLAATMGLKAVWVSLDTLDWVNVNSNPTQVVPAVTSTFSKYVSQGLNNQISLEHDVYSPTANAAVASLDILLKAGYTIQSIHECLGESTPYNNTILEGFFRSGVFESKNLAIQNPPPLPAILTDPLAFGIGNTSSIIATNATITTNSSALVASVVPPTKSGGSRVVFGWSILTVMFGFL
ncbi:UNVERIFIED_CONTAM: chitin deacetylase [Siphonaria sp. JEL0065]|nr:chitin deacetylase [Siphonaria sp. JEL0065]